MDIKSIQSKFPPLNALNFNRKNFQKEVKKNYDYIKIMSRYGLTQKGNEFEVISKSINNTLREILLKDETFSNGNIYYVLTILNSHHEFLKDEISKIINKVLSIETLTNIQNDMISQHNEISEALKNNLREPVSYENLCDTLGLDINDLGENNGE